MKPLHTEQLDRVRQSLLEHPIYREVNAPEKVRLFMKHHVFAVWDFMSLLKRMQMLLTVTTVPWVPGKDAFYARFINEIVLGEETDEDGNGGYISHFELYVQAMEQTGADATPMHRFLDRLKEGRSVAEALVADDIPSSVRKFVGSTMEIVLHGQPHEVAAAFFFGREDIIPDMFTHLVGEIREQGGEVDRLVYYMDRHIELDGDRHGPMAEKLVRYLCGGDAKKEAEAFAVAEACLRSRIELWDGVVAELRGLGQTVQA
jgi:hypothetical protein